MDRTDAFERALRNETAASDLGAAAALLRIEPRCVGALNKLHAAQVALTISLGGLDTLWRWRFTATAPDVDAHETYAFRLGRHAGRVALDEQAHTLLLGEPDAQRLPRELRCVLLADALAPWVRRLEQSSHQRFEWTLAPAQRSAPAPSRCADFDLERTNDVWPMRGGGRIECDDAALLECIAAAFASPAVGAHAIDWLRWPLAFELGRTPLRLHELRGVRRGDIVAIEHWRSDGSAIETAVMLGRSHRTSLTALADGSEAVLSPWKEFTMDTIDTPAAADAKPAAVPLERLDGMEVMLRFEVGDLAVSLRELRSLEPGHVFDLGQPLNRSTVRILAHGNLLGTGHLVALGDRLGVRVAEFAPNADE